MASTDTARLLWAEHSYPAPTRNHLSQRNADAAKRNPVMSGKRTVAGPVRTLRIKPDGTRVPYVKSGRQYTDAELILIDRELRKQELRDRLAKQGNIGTASFRGGDN